MRACDHGIKKEISKIRKYVKIFHKMINLLCLNYAF